jgi:hypothetical protein
LLDDAKDLLNNSILFATVLSLTTAQSRQLPSEQRVKNMMHQYENSRVSYSKPFISEEA